MTAAASVVSAVAMHTLLTYSVLLGSAQVVHDPAVLTVDVKLLPAVHALHTPSTPPPALAVPAA